MNLSDQIVSALEKEISQLPNRFYDSFDYTTTGQNYTHPVTLGLLAKILWQIPKVCYVAIDFRLNDSGAKFQPDLVALAQIKPLEPILFLDYESPNSCDSRIPVKDVGAYEEWCAVYKKRIPYFIVTTLPNKVVSDWELRYTAKSGYNWDYHGKREDVRKNPFTFWYSEYRRLLKNVSDIYFINIDGKHVEHVSFRSGG